MIAQKFHKFDFDSVEVSYGKCLKLSARKFIDCPLQDKDIGKKSPRMFTTYDSNTVAPDAKYVTESVHHSFPEEKKRAQFLNKFYQRLLAFRFHTSYENSLLLGQRILGRQPGHLFFYEYVPFALWRTAITKEKLFSAAMINNNTHIVLSDEWSENTLQADLAKTVLQGGYMVTAVKHGEARTIIN